MFCRNREKVSEFPTFCASMTMATKIYPTHSDVYCIQGQHDIGYHILN